MYSVKITDIFAKETKKLSKKYRHIQKDCLPLLDQLEAGQLVGDAVSGFDNKLYKVRVPSSDQKKGKRGGFRVIYYIVSDENEIFLLTIYAKATQANIKNNDVRKMLDQLEL
jgi:mRNA-degrading endonuclease RelE of RelBE toxin-antitoxin system